MFGLKYSTQNVKRIILHIGRHKSGTSALQSYFFLNREEFSPEGILYPLGGRVGNGIAHHQLAYACDHKRNPKLHELKKVTAEICEEVQDHHHTLVISSESFQVVTDFGRVRMFLKKFKNADVEIICYFREFADYMMSSFRQATQNQDRFRTFDQFLKHKIDVATFTREWSKLGEFKMKWFHPDLLLEKDVIADFCRLTELPLIANARNHRNTSLGGNILLMKFLTNHAGKKIFSYDDLAMLATKRPRYRKPFFVESARIDKARGRTRYNAFLEEKMGAVPLKYWDQYRVLPDEKFLEEDLEIIRRQVPNVEMTPFLPLIPRAKDWF